MATPWGECNSPLLIVLKARNIKKLINFAKNKKLWHNHYLSYMFILFFMLKMKKYWQGGYSGYSVSQSKVSVVSNYIEKQKEHHKKLSFKEEYLRFLQEYDVNFDEKYLWR